MEALKLGVQLYSIREYVEKDFPGSLKKVKEMGYDGVELAGLFGYSPEAIRDMIIAAGLQAISAHVIYEAFEDDMDKTIQDYKTIGCSYIALPSLPERLRPGKVDFEEAIAFIEKIGIACKKQGIMLLYHNHDFEFVTLNNGKYGLDELYDRISPSYLQTEIDTCWVNVAGEDPAEYIKKYTGRCPIVHLKDYYASQLGGDLYELIGEDSEERSKSNRNSDFEFRPVGYGVQNFDKIVSAALTSGAAWVIVEQDNLVVGDPMGDVKISIDYLRKL